MNSRHYLLFTFLKLLGVALLGLLVLPQLFAQNEEGESGEDSDVFQDLESFEDDESAFLSPAGEEGGQDGVFEEDLPPEPFDDREPGDDQSDVLLPPDSLTEDPRLPEGLGRFLQRQGSILLPNGLGGNRPREGASIEEQQETIDKAIVDLESDEPNIRQSAVMILGKYRLPSARQALLGALDDPAPQVRQSALVAMLEDPLQMGSHEMLNVLEMVDDENVHIRRLATSAVAQWMPSGLITSSAGGHLRSSPYTPQLRQKILAAFQDDDLTVRRNITAAYPTLRLDLGDPVYRQLLTDSDREIRMNMLQGLMNIFPQKLVQLAGLLLDDPDVTIRRELASFLSSFMVPGVEKYLQTLAQDEDFVVRQTAQLALYQLEPNRKTLEPLLAQLNDQRTSQEMAGRIVYSVTSLDGDAPREILEDLLKDPQPKYMAEVLQLYSSLYRTHLSPEMVLPFTEDSSSEVRLTAMSALQRIQGKVEQQHLKRLMTSRYPDVREQVTSLTRSLSPKVSEDILFELLLDEDDRVRISALREMATRRIPGWQDVLARSLDDPNPELVQMSILLFAGKPDPASISTLQEFAARCDDPKLRGLAIAQAQRLERELQATGQN